MNTKRNEAKHFLKRLYRCNASFLEYKKGLEGLQEITTNNQSSDLPLDYTKKISDYQNQLEKKISSIIEQVPDRTLLMLLRYRYIDFLNWDEIAFRMDCTLETIHTKHNAALDAVAEILSAEKAAEKITNEELVDKIQSGVEVQKNMGLLYTKNKNIIFRCALPYSKKLEMQDLMQEAYFGLDKAVKKYDSSKGYKFLTYAVYWIRAVLCQYYHKCGRLKRIPSTIIMLLSSYHHFVYEYESTNGETPSDEQIKEHLKVSDKQYNSLKMVLNESICSLDDVIPGTDLTVSDGVADEMDVEDIVLASIGDNQVNAVIWDSVNELPQRLKEIIKLRYKSKSTLADIAEKYGVSGNRISQCENKALKLLKADARMQYAAEYYDYDCGISYSGGKAFFDGHGSSTEYIALKRVESETKRKQINKLIEEMDWAV